MQIDVNNPKKSEIKKKPRSFRTENVKILPLY